MRMSNATHCFCYVKVHYCKDNIRTVGNKSFLFNFSIDKEILEKIRAIEGR